MPPVVLVTGASGLIGARTLEPLQALGFDVRGVARNPPVNPVCPFIAADLLDAQAMRAVLASVQPTHVLHCAWDVTHGKFWHAPENLDWAAASLLLAKAAAEAGVQRFVGVGTGAEYDWSDDGVQPRRESDPAVPVTLYGQAKNTTRLLQEAYFRTTGTSFAWGRVFDLFGTGEAGSRLVPSAISALRAGQPFACRQGQLLRDYLAVEDVGLALAHLVASPVQGAVNIASGTPISLADLTRHIAAVIGCPDLLTVETHPAQNQPLTIRPDITRLRQEVGAPPPPPLWTRVDAYLASSQPAHRGRD